MGIQPSKISIFVDFNQEIGVLALGLLVINELGFAFSLPKQIDPIK